MDDSKRSYTREKWPYKGWLALVLLVVVGLWLINLIVMVRLSESWSVRGTIGDSFGVVNALFSGLAFAGVIYAILLQKRELQLQRQELEDTRTELKGQKEQLLAQNQTLKSQMQDNRFFQLFTAHQEMVNAFSTQQGQLTLRGRGVLDWVLGRLRERVWTDHGGGSVSPESIPVSGTIDELYEQFGASYEEKFYRNWRSKLSHYFGSLTNLLRFILNSHPDDQLDYIDAVRGQLSDQELSLIIVHCAFYERAKLLRDLVLRLAILKNVNPENSADEYERRLLRYVKGPAKG